MQPVRITSVRLATVMREWNHFSQFKFKYLPIEKTYQVGYIFMIRKGFKRGSKEGQTVIHNRFSSLSNISKYQLGATTQIGSYGRFKEIKSNSRA